MATAKSRTGLVIMYPRCPVTWATKMEFETALSVTEAEFIALSEGLHTNIPIMNLNEDLKEEMIGVSYREATVMCRLC